MEFLNTKKLPYCKGCGHHLVAYNTVKALKESRFKVLDIVLVTDIGCHGIIDKCFNTHTVHGLHGRAIALGMGIAFTLPRRKRVIVFVGDGGVTLGISHLLEGGRLNLPMTVIVHNNMLYGMTGGQASGFTPCGFKTTTTKEGNTLLPYDLYKISKEIGIPYFTRILGYGDFSHKLIPALKTEGFSLVEVVEVCPSYGLKLNPTMKLKKIAQEITTKIERKPFTLKKIHPTPGYSFLTPIVKPSLVSSYSFFKLLISGSAGQGIQRGTSLLGEIGVRYGFYVSKKGKYPVTVGVGFSVGELIFSKEEIKFTGIDTPDGIIITSKEGWEQVEGEVEKMRKGVIVIEKKLLPLMPSINRGVRIYPFTAKDHNTVLINGVKEFLSRVKLFPSNAWLSLVKHRNFCST